MPHQDDYQEAEPRPELRPWLRRVWTYASDGADRRPQRIAPDGCPELILHLGAPYAELDAHGAFVLQPQAVFAGQLIRPLVLRPTGPVRIVALRFEPDGAAAWFGSRLDAATDRRIDVGGRSELAAVLTDAEAGDLAAISDGLQARLAEALAGWSAPDPRVREAVRRAEAGEPLAPETPAARRQLQRRFLAAVGVPLRTFRSVVRFRRLFARLRDPDGEAWLAAALRSGYFDQPQMARDFRRFLGCTATEWAAEQDGLAERIASQTYKTAVVPSD